MTTPLPFNKYEEVFVDRMIKKEVVPGAWRLEAAPTSVDGKGPSAKIAVNGGVDGASCEFTYPVANTPYTVQTTLSTVERSQGSCNENACCAKVCDVVNRFSPAVTYHKDEHAVTAKIATGVVDYEFKHPAFHGTASVHATSGFATLATLSARIQQNLYGGLYLNYDPFRSGLRNYTLSLLARNVAQAKNGDVLVSFDATRGLLVGLTAPLKDNIQGTVTLRPSKVTQTLQAGLDVRSPCGAQVLAHVDVGQQLLGLTFSRIIQGAWRLSLGWTISNAHNTVTTKFGLTASKDF